MTPCYGKWDLGVQAAGNCSGTGSDWAQVYASDTLHLLSPTGISHAHFVMNKILIQAHACMPSNCQNSKLYFFFVSIFIHYNLFRELLLYLFVNIGEIPPSVYRFFEIGNRKEKNPTFQCQHCPRTKPHRTIHTKAAENFAVPAAF